MLFDDEFTDRPDWPLVKNGAVNLFYKPRILHQFIKALEEMEYNIIHLEYSGREQFRIELSESLKWEKQYNDEVWDGNFNALNDALRGEPFESADRNAVVLENFDALVKDDKVFAFTLLDYIESHSRNYLLFGKVLTALIQTNDPNYACEGIGARGANWNMEERMRSKRG